MRLLILILAFAATLRAEPRINEFLADNAANLADEDGAFSDWIELHNPGPGSVDLAGWRLTDDPTLLAKWALPAFTLAAGQFRIVFASGKNRVNPAATLHANFSLGAGGEYLALVRPDGTVAQEFAPEFPQQSADRSFGVSGGGAFFFNTPTPGAANGTPSSSGIVADTQFSHTRGLFTAPFALTITTATPGATIRYTTNGSKPTATAGTVYSTPINISATTVLRAAAFKTGLDPSNVDTQTFLFLDGVILQQPSGSAPPGWPSGSPNGQLMQYGMDPDIVNSANTAIGGAAQVKAALAALPVVSLAIAQSDFTGTSAGIYVNATQRGPAWERAASIEMINDAQFGGGFQSECGLRIRGNFSRGGEFAKHSLRVFFRSEYGNAKLGYPLFGDDGADEFDGFDIQSPQDAGWSSYSPDLCNYLRDTWSRDTMGALGQPTTRSRWTHVFINGIYWGMFQIEERPEASFGATYLGGSKDDYDVIKATGLADGYVIEATDGYLTGPAPQTSAWESFFAQARSHFTAPGEVKYFALQGLAADGITPNGQPRLLEVDNFADYLIMVMHSANTDMLSSYWVGYQPNNFYCLRRRGGALGFINVAHDGETSLDWYAGDYDRTGPAGDPALRTNFDYSNPEFFHNDLTPSLEYRTRFGDRAHRALYNGGALTMEKSQARLDKRAAEVELGIIAESARWGDSLRPAQPYTKADWLSARDATRAWFASRRELFITQLRADGLYPAETAPAFSQHGGEVPLAHALTMNGASAPVFYTLDGSDPRLIGGGLRPGALSYTGGTANNVTLIAQGAVWKYRDNGSDQGAAWSQPGFNDSAWSSGPAQLGYGESDEATRVEDNATPGYNAADTNRYITTYFRRAFTVTGAANFTGLNLELQRDDGAVVYLNGQEVWRTSMPATGDILFTTPADASTSGSDEAVFFPRTLNPALLVEGANVLAVEVHQRAADSSDVSFDLRLTGTQTTGAQHLTLPAGLTRLNARARTAAGAWSALTSADFLVGADYAEAANLVIAEIMFHPVDGDAEFIELLNRGTKPVDLRGVRLAGAVRFTFPENQPLLAPGARVVVVRNAAAFTIAHGVAFAGQYSGNFDNNGEPLRLLAPDGTVLHEVAYNDTLPWPGGTESTGRSLVLSRASSNPAAVASWRASVAAATPGTSDGVTFAVWKIANGITSDTGDDDGDGLNNFTEYFFGTPPHTPNVQPLTLALETATTLIFTARTTLAADEALITPQTSPDLANWSAAAATLIASTPHADGTVTRTWRLTIPLGATRHFARLRAVLEPL